MSGGPLGAILERKLAWQGVFVIGVVSLLIAALKAWWASSSPAYHHALPPAAAIPPTSSVVNMPAPAPQVIKPLPVVSTVVVRPVTPASSFTPSRIAPDILPPELSSLTRPPPDPPPYVPPIGVQPGYMIPENPEPKDIR